MRLIIEQIFRTFGYLGQMLTVFFYIFISYKIIKKNFNNYTKFLIGYLLVQTAGYLLLSITAPFRKVMNQDIFYIIYVISLYFILISFIFLYQFFYRFKNINQKKKFKIFFAICLILGSLGIILIFTFFPITIIEGTARYSWIMFYLLILVDPGFIFMLILFDSYKIHKKFKDKKLKKKIKFLSLGIIFTFIEHYGQALYNTCLNCEIFNILFPFFSFVLIIPIFFLFLNISIRIKFDE